MKEPVKIDASVIKEQIASCEEWLEKNKGKNPSQERDTEIGVACWKQILQDSKPI